MIELVKSDGEESKDKNEAIFQKMESDLIRTMTVSVKIGKQEKTQDQIERELANRQRL